VRKAEAAIVALLDNVTSAPHERRARILVWLGRAVRSVRFTRGVLANATRDVIAIGDRAGELARSRECIRVALSGRTPSLDDKRRLTRLDGEIRALEARYGVSLASLKGTAQHLRHAQARASALRDEIITSNLRLVVSVVRRYVRHGLPLADLIQEGNIGLMHAVEKFDWRRGTKFSTYAVNWLRQAAQRSLDCQLRTVRLPVHSAELLRRIVRLDATDEKARKRYTPEQLAEELTVPIGRVRAVCAAPTTVVSLDAPLSEDGTVSMATTLRDNAEDPEARLLTIDRRAKIDEALATLTERERLVIRLRFGLDPDESEQTLETIGRQLGVSRERVRQIQVQALEKLRRPATCAKLAHYV